MSAGRLAELKSVATAVIQSKPTDGTVFRMLSIAQSARNLGQITVKEKRLLLGHIDSLATKHGVYERHIKKAVRRKKTTRRRSRR